MTALNALHTLTIQATAADVYRITGGSRELIQDAWKRLSDLRVDIVHNGYPDAEREELILDIYTTLQLLSDAIATADSDDIDDHRLPEAVFWKLRQAQLGTKCLKAHPRIAKNPRWSDAMGGIHELTRDAMGPLRVVVENIRHHQGKLAPDAIAQA